MTELHDIDPLETQEWLDALNAVIENEGVERAHFLLEQLIDDARRNGANLPFTNNTAYLNTIPTHLEQRTHGDPELENRIRSFTITPAIQVCPSWSSERIQDWIFSTERITWSSHNQPWKSICFVTADRI